MVNRKYECYYFMTIECSDIEMIMTINDYDKNPRGYRQYAILVGIPLDFYAIVEVWFEWQNRQMTYKSPFIGSRGLLK